MKRRTLGYAAGLVVMLGIAWWSARERGASETAKPNDRSVATEDLTAPSDVVVEPPAAGSRASRSVSDVVSATNAPAAEPPSLRIRLVDDLTGEAVPWFDATLEPGGRAVTSDAAGLVSLDAPPEPGELALELTENLRGTPDRIQTKVDTAKRIPTRASFVPGAADAAPADVAIPVGPTYRLALSLPAGYAIDDLAASLRSADPSKAFDVAFGSPRDPSAPWVRFRATARVLKGGPPWRLAVETGDGLAYGDAIVPSNSGILAESVEISLEPRARLAGRVLDEQGAAIEDGLVRIQRDGASSSDAANRPMFGLVGAGGAYRIPCIAPGEYEVKLQRDGFADFQSRLSLAAGEERDLEIVLRKNAASELGRIEGRVESTTGRFERALYPFAKPLASGRPSRNGRVGWRDENGRRVGAFAFDELAPGEYVIELVGAGLRRVEPKEHRARTGDPAVVFTVLDGDGPVHDVTLEVRDANGAPVPKFRSELSYASPEGLLADRISGRDGRATFGGAVAGRSYSFEVWAEGFQPVWGELELGDEPRTVPISLKTGWGTEVYVRAADRTPLQGARVSFDGSPAGETDARGELRVALDHEPQLATVEYLDWKRSPDSRLDENGRFRTFEPFLDVVLEPPPR
jgi:hypothetical protein